MDTLIPKLKTVSSAVVQFAAIMTVLTPIAVWFYRTVDARAEAYIEKVMEAPLTALSDDVKATGKQIEDLVDAVNKLLKNQSAQTDNSAEAALIGRQILCLQQRQADPLNAPSIDECMAAPPAQ